MGYERFSNEPMNLYNYAVKYPDCKRVPASEAVFYPPENDEQEAIAAAVKKRAALTPGIFAAVFGLMFLIALLRGLIGTALIFLPFAAVPAYFAVGELTSPALVAAGSVAFKRIRSSSGIRAPGPVYLVSVKPDLGDAVIYTDIRISNGEFNKAGSGTPVVVVKTIFRPVARLTR